MEVIPEGKHFKLVNDDELPAIMKILEQYLPEALKFHQTIKTYLNDRVWQFYFYVSKNWPEEPICLHFPGCTLTPKQNIYGSFGIFCPTERIECIDVLETEDVLIDWKEPMYLNFTHIDIMNRLDSFYQNYGVMERLLGDIYICQRAAQQREQSQDPQQDEDENRGGREEEEEQEEEEEEEEQQQQQQQQQQLLLQPIELDSLPNEEVEMRPLTIDNVKAIHDLYPASEIECVQVFEKLIDALPGFGIFTKNTGELAAWMMHSYYGAMFSMQTKPEFRRKGYGIHLAQALTETVIERGYSPFVVIRPENDASRNLYKKLGFKKAFETARVTLNPTKDIDVQQNNNINIKFNNLRDGVNNDDNNNNIVDNNNNNNDNKHDNIDNINNNNIDSKNHFNKNGHVLDNNDQNNVNIVNDNDNDGNDDVDDDEGIEDIRIIELTTTTTDQNIENNKDEGIAD